MGFKISLNNTMGKKKREEGQWLVSGEKKDFSYISFGGGLLALSW